MSVLGANETMAWRRPEDEPSDRFLAATRFMVAAQLVGLTLYAVLAVLTVLRLYELREAVRNGGARKKKVQGAMSITLWLLLHALCGFLGQLSNAVTSFTDFPSRETVWRCHAAHKWGAFIYITAITCQLAILLERSKATLDRQHFWSNLIFKGTALMTVIGMPAITLVGIIIFEGSVFYGNAGGYCTQQLPLWLVWLFMASSTGLNSCYLLLFLLPVYAHLKKSTLQSGDATSKEGQAATKAANKLRRTANKNLRLSTVQIVSTLVTQVVGLTFQTFFRDDGDHPENAYLRQVQYGVYIVDMIINTSALMLLTNAWKPTFLPRRRRKVHADNNGTGASSMQSTSVLSDDAHGG